METRQETIKEWLNKGNEIKVVKPFEPKIIQYFGKTSSKMRRSRTTKGKNK